jgi:hypothetical protein
MRNDFYPPACEFRIRTDAAYVNRALAADHHDAADYDQRYIERRILHRKMQYERIELARRRSKATTKEAA